jgi:hypothetical protein
MRFPRFTISGLMALVLLVAVDAWACKALLTHGPPYSVALSELIVVGALPMANVLALGLYPILMARHDHERGRLGLVGFEVGGLTALLLYLAGSVLWTHSLHEGVVHVLRAFGLLPGPVSGVAAVAMLILPQLALAILGARLGRTYKVGVSVTVEQRSAPDAESGPIPERPVVAEGL